MQRENYNKAKLQCIMFCIYININNDIQLTHHTYIPIDKGAHS